MNEDFNEMMIKEMLVIYPEIEAVLTRHRIGCVRCKIGTCRLKDVIKIHNLGKTKNKILMEDITSIIHQEL